MKRLIECTPRELIGLSRQEFLASVKAAEGRTVVAGVGISSPNILNGVSNIEVAAAFGADCISLEISNSIETSIPGLPSKNASDDAEHQELGVKMGKGWTINELQKLTGRRITSGLLVVRQGGEQTVLQPAAGNAIYCRENLRNLVETLGYSHIMLVSFEQDILINAVRESREIVGDEVILEAGIPHGLGNANLADRIPYNLRDIVSGEFVQALAEAGADIVAIPAVGSVPGFNMQYVSELIDAIHEKNALAAVLITHSMEDSDEQALTRIALDNKACGTDIYSLASGGLNLGMTDPMNLMKFCIVAKGKRNAYKRICQSIEL